MAQVGKIRIAFLTREITGVAASHILSGVMDAAEQRGLELTVFQGGQLGHDPAALLYGLVDSQAFSGIISWASSDQDSSLGYFDKFGAVPIVTLSLALPNHPSVSADSYAGMRAAVDHLITVHGLKRLAFVRGPDAHVYAKERYKAYQDALAANGIGPDERLVAPCGSWDRQTGQEAVRLFLDNRRLVPGKDLEAIVCVNDNAAIGAMEALLSRGVKVPKDVAIVGYNDSKEARCMTPPITSVAMPFRDQGFKAVDIIVALLEGRTAERGLTLPAQLVLGQSCGCQSQGVAQAAAQAAAQTAAEVAAAVRTEGRRPWFGRRRPPEPVKCVIADDESLVEDMVESALGGKRSLTDQAALIRSQTRIILDAFMEELKDDLTGHFLQRLSEALRTLVEEAVAVEMFQNAVSVMRQRLLAKAAACGRADKAEDLWAQARVMISETAARMMESGYFKLAQQERAMQFVGDKLLATYDVPRLYEILAIELPKLGLPSFYLALYDDKRIPSTAAPPAEATLAMGCDSGGRLQLGAGGRRFATRDILPSEFRRGGGLYIVEALHLDGQHFGYLVFGVGPREYAVYDTLRAQLSSALYGALLLQENAAVKAVLQHTLDSMETKACVVSDRSESIARHVDGISAAMEEVAASIREIARNVQDVLNVVQATVDAAQGATENVSSLAEQSREIDGIVRIITDVAEETKILSLNAAIEAARAGAAGKGFAVVAKEVKDLALDTVNSAESIVGIIEKFQLGTKEAATAIARVKEIVVQAADLSRLMKDSINEQEKATDDISALLIEAARGTSEIAEAIAEVAGIGQKAKDAVAGG